jgi:hypothetical protein
MTSRFRFACASVLLSSALPIRAAAQANLNYQRPPKAIVDLVGPYQLPSSRFAR